MIGKACSIPGCPTVIQRGQRCCAEHTRAVEQRRGSSSERGYGSRWQRARETYIRSHPLCVECKREGRITAATVVDHITPHKGDAGLMWSEGNWQALCAVHHNRKTARDDGGFGRSTSPAGASVAGAGRDTHAGAAPQGAGRSLGTARP